MNQKLPRLSVLALLGLTILPLLGCGSSASPTATTKALRSYYPEFRVNNRWAWRVTEAGATRTETVTIGGTESRDSGTAYLVETKDATGKRLYTDVLSLTDRRLLQHGWIGYDEAGNQDDSIRYPAPWGLDLWVENGQESDQSFVLNDTLEGMPVVSTFRIRIQNQGLEQVTVPAGTFSAVKQRVRTTLTVKVGDETGSPEESAHTEWRVEGIGPVKSVDSDGVTRELTGAQVNGATIP